MRRSMQQSIRRLAPPQRHFDSQHDLQLDHAVDSQHDLLLSHTTPPKKPVYADTVSAFGAFLLRVYTFMTLKTFIAINLISTRRRSRAESPTLRNKSYSPDATHKSTPRWSRLLSPKTGELTINLRARASNLHGRRALAACESRLPYARQNLCPRTAIPFLRLRSRPASRSDPPNACSGA